MKNKSNELLWTTAESLAKDYSMEMDAVKKDAILGDLFFTLNDYMFTSIHNSVKNAQSYGLSIPQEDFESRFFEYLWDAIEAYEVGGSTLKNIVIRRFRFAQAHTWRQYKKKGNADDKDGVTYSSARWDSLDREIGGGNGEENKTMADFVLGEVDSAEAEYFDNTDEQRIIKGFEKVNPRYANVIHYMAQGYDGDELAIITGEADSNNSKMRKLIQRSKASFAEYMNVK